MNRRSSGTPTYRLKLDERVILKVKFPITSSPRARPSNWVNAALYSYMIVAVSLHKTHICVVKSLVKIAAVSWHSLRRFIKPATVAGFTKPLRLTKARLSEFS